MQMPSLRNFLDRLNKQAEQNCHENTDAVKLSTGTKVYWYDPAGETSGVYEILIKPNKRDGA